MTLAQAWKLIRGMVDRTWRLLPRTYPRTPTTPTAATEPTHGDRCTAAMVVCEPGPPPPTLLSLLTRRIAAIRGPTPRNPPPGGLLQPEEVSEILGAWRAHRDRLTGGELLRDLRLAARSGAVVYAHICERGLVSLDHLVIVHPVQPDWLSDSASAIVAEPSDTLDQSHQSPADAAGQGNGPEPDPSLCGDLQRPARLFQSLVRSICGWRSSSSTMAQRLRRLRSWLP
jgi:hypothetical protein